MKNVRRRACDLKGLRLTPEEGFVLSRLDIPLSIRELVALTGIEEPRVAQIVAGLASQGAVDLESSEGEGGGVSLAPAPSSPTRRPPEEEEPVETADVVADPGEEADQEAEGDGESQDPAEIEKRAQGSREYQKIYEETYRPMERDARIAAAGDAAGSHLFALCLDPDPQVIGAVLTNPKSGLDHARMIATHHRTHIGLDFVGRRNELMSDHQVQRRLLVNPQLPDTLLRRIVSPKLLSDVYKIAINREIPERSRIMTRELMQKKFMLASPDERAALLTKTEGRCLIVLVNCALDARTTQLLTSKTTYTLLFVQNLARWSATPPALLAHLMKQPQVRMNPGMKKMLLKHRNMPSEIKRNSS